MQFERRKQLRRPIDISARLFTAVDAPVWDCVVMDLSAHGARLAVESSNDVPDNFTLLLSDEARKSHSCRVIWRAGHQLGVKFVALASADTETSPNAAPRPALPERRVGSKQDDPY